MLTYNILDSFSSSINQWYQLNKRELPWRNTNDPYKIWLSEIILQQTRVNQGLSYYNRFVERFPNVKSLADAEEEDVLKLWQGLGYYSRARNIHATAKIIKAEYDGVFPTAYEDIITLKGIGEYTASAISSFAYNNPYAVLDGNVFRVLARIFGIDTPIDSGIGKKEFTNLASVLLDKKHPAIHNQAIMEFGALQCVPGQPQCENCIFNNVCIAYSSGLVLKLPKKSQKTKQRERFFNYFCIQLGKHTYIQKRIGSDVWKNLYEFPLIETDSDFDLSELMKTNAYQSLFEKVTNIEIKSNHYSVKHILSHQKIHTKFYTIIIGSESKALKSFTKTPINKLQKYPVSRLTELFLTQQE